MKVILWLRLELRQVVQVQIAALVMNIDLSRTFAGHDTLYILVLSK